MVDGHYSVRGTAQVLAVSEETVRRYIREGKLKATKVSRVGLNKVWGILPAHLREFQERLSS